MGERNDAGEDSKLKYLAVESESLRLFLEPEDDASEDITNVETNETTKEVLNASTVSENTNKEGLSKSANRINLPELKGALAKLGSPKLGKTAPKLSKQTSDDFLTFEVDKEDYSSEDKGLSDLKNRFVKHIKCSRQRGTTLKASNNEPVQMTVVSKETDSRGREHLKTQTLNYISNGQSPNPKKEINFERVRMAKKSERIGAQQVSLKMILKEKIDQKRKNNLMKKEELKKVDNEEENDIDNETNKEEDILDDEEMSEESEEESEDEGVDWDEEEARLEADDRRKERKRIKKGSFLDEEAEDDDGNGDSLDAFQTGGDNIISKVTNKTMELPDTEEILGPRVENENTTQSTPISMVKETKESDFFAEPFSENSASARKKLGFGELFDITDPKVDDMDDVIGLCSGHFLTQPNNGNLSQDAIDNVKSRSQYTQDIYQDTPDTVILTQNLTESQNGNLDNSEDLLGSDFPSTKFLRAEVSDKPKEADEMQPGFMQDDIGALDLLSSSEDETVTGKKVDKKTKKMKKRKRLVVSDDDSDSDNENDVLDSDKEKEDNDIMYDSEENEIEPGDSVEAEKVEFKGFKSKKGRLRKEFVEEEAELSGDSN